MPSIIQKIFRKSFKKKGKDRILHEISEEDLELKFNKKLKAAMKYIQSLEAQLSKRQAQDRLKETKKEDFEEEVDLIKQLEKKEREIEKKRYEGVYSINRINEVIKRVKKRNKKIKYVITDKDDKTTFDEWGSFVIMKDGMNMGVQGKSKEIWIEGRTIYDLIHKPECMKNYIKRKRIPLACDESLRKIPDFEKIEINEQSYDESDGYYHESEERVRKIKDKFLELDETNRKLREDKQHLEQTIADLRNKLQDVELAKETWKKQTENSQSELSVALANEKEMNKKFVQLDRDLTVAQEQKLLSDKIKEKYDEEFDKIISELEDEKSKDEMARARGQIWGEIERARKYALKEKEIIHKKEGELKKDDRKTEGL